MFEEMPQWNVVAEKEQERKMKESDEIVGSGVGTRELRDSLYGVF